MTSIFINAISVREGGSLVVLRELLIAMAELRPQWFWHLATNHQASAQLPVLRNSELHIYPAASMRGISVRSWYELELPRLLKRTRADLLFSQTNYLPFRKLSCPTLLLVQHAGHFSTRFRELLHAANPGLPARVAWYFKNHWVRSSVTNADGLTVQTRALEQEIMALGLRAAGSIAVIPHGPGIMGMNGNHAVLPAPGAPLRIGYITKFGVQKNFTVLFKAIRSLADDGIPCRLVLTLDPVSRENRHVLQEAEELGITELIENHGELSPESLLALYRSLNLFVFPSLCESFGFPLVEAMASGLPVLIADTPSNREVAGVAAPTFPAHDHTSLVRTIIDIKGNPSYHAELARRSLDQASSYNWKKSAEKYIELIETLITVKEGA